MRFAYCTLQNYDFPLNHVGCNKPQAHCTATP
jgi:hypothetical protein